MGPASAINGAINAGTQLSDLVTRLYDLRDDNNRENATSMTKLSKSTSVTSRVYIEESIAGEDIAAPLMSALNQLYIGYVMTTLKLHATITRYDVVRTAIARVANENLHVDMKSVIGAEFGKTVIAPKTLTPSMEAEVVDMDKRVSSLAIGKVINFEFDVGNDKDGKVINVEVPIQVNLLPAAITSNVAEAFLGLNFQQSFTQRWSQYRAGELSLFKDILLSRDLVDRFATAIREDNTNVLKDMVNQKNNARGLQIKSVLTQRANNNIASSICIFDKRTFETAAHTHNFNFSKYDDRQRFFDAAMAMIVVVVDLNYNMVEIYLNGIDATSNIPFRLVEKAGSAKDGIDIKTLMATMAKGNAPKF